MAYRYPDETEAQMQTSGGWQTFSHGEKINSLNNNPRIRVGSNWVNLRGEYHPVSTPGALSRYIFTRSSDNKWKRLTATQPFYYGDAWYDGEAGNLAHTVNPIRGPIQYSAANTYWPIALLLQVNFASGTYPSVPTFQYAAGGGTWTSFVHLTPSITFADSSTGAHKARISLMGVTSPVNWTSRQFRCNQLNTSGILGFSYTGYPVDPYIVFAGDGKNQPGVGTVSDTRSPTLDIGTGYRWLELHTMQIQAGNTPTIASTPASVLGTGVTQVTAANGLSANAWRTWDDRYNQSAQAYTMRYQGIGTPGGMMWGAAYMALPTGALALFGEPGFVIPGVLNP
jgi:hypothetical protein